MCFRGLYPTACLTLQNTGSIKGSQILKAYIFGEEGPSGSNSKVCFYWMVFNISKLALIDSKLSLQKEKKIIPTFFWCGRIVVVLHLENMMVAEQLEMFLLL